MAVSHNISAAIVELTGALGERVSVVDAIREFHSHDESHHEPHLPDAVVTCLTTEDVVAVLQTCRRHDVPVVPFGTGTGLEGGAIPVSGGVSLDLSQMVAIRRISLDDLDATVQAGVTRLQLNKRIGGDGLFFPVDPGADASLGGMAATRASGTNAVRYGTMRENVLGLEVVLSDGRVIHTGTRARKSAAGYDLTRLFVGSEGTLGVITEVTVRLYGIPETVVAASCAFSDLAGAVRTVVSVIQLGIPVARAEVLDAATMDAIRRRYPGDWRIAPTLFFEFHGGAASVEEQLADVARLAAEEGGGELSYARSTEERSAMWRARHGVLPATRALRPGAVTWSTDVCVPISTLPEIVAQTNRDLEKNGVLASLAGHVGDGNFHLTFLLDPSDPTEHERAAAVNARMVVRAQEMGGTCTGEHGIGSGKVQFMHGEHGQGVDVMREIKAALDPTGILNPGKVLPADGLTA